MITEIEINGARLIIRGENIAVSLSETDSVDHTQKPVVHEISGAGMRFIRKNVFRMNQIDFADLVGVHQSSVSRWENGTPPSLHEMKIIRSAAAQRRLKFPDSLFFEVSA